MDLPARIGKYELQKFLGGGMSHVYRARDTLIGRTVAVKILTPAGASDPEVKQRFLQEARMAGNISHENVISIFDFGEQEGQLFLVMEFLVGDDLSALLKANRAGDLVHKLSLALQVAKALEYVHSQGITHRDIKPENIHVTSKGVVKLMDFGIAKLEGLELTRAGYVLGTPYYMSPEQVRGEQPTHLVDVYAFGILLFEMVTGVKPFQGDTIQRLFYCILNEPLNLQPVQDAGVHDSVRDLICHCTAKNPAERPADFTQIRRELEAQIAHLTVPQTAKAVEAAVVPKRPSGNPRGRWIALGGVAFLLALVVAYAILRPRATAPAALPPPVTPAKHELARTLATETGEMELVPAGAFLSGEQRESVSIPAFYIDRTEVTRAAYAKFCHAAGRPLPASFATAGLDYPITDITILDAMDFAKWAGKRLPGMLEWEKAARGADGRIYPWGNDADPLRANVKDNPNSPGKAMPVESFAQYSAPFGAINMIGNVWEFVDQVRTPSKGAMAMFKGSTMKERWYTMRGGAYTIPIKDAVVYEWAAVPGTGHKVGIGFRCVKDP